MEAETRNAQTLLRAGNHEEALHAASQLFELCTEADFQASIMLGKHIQGCDFHLSISSAERTGSCHSD